MINISGHSVDETLLKRDSKVLDLGCRDFEFTNGILKYVDTAYCVDADNSVNPPGNVHFINAAVGNSFSISHLIKYGDGIGNFIYAGEPLSDIHTTQAINVYPLAFFNQCFEVEKWDLIKFDIEGSEYDILMNLTYPPANQLTVELHEHTAKRRGEKFVQQLFKHLDQWYNRVVCVHNGINYKDILFIQK
jgi:FkbM family methyltransferase